MDNLKQVFFDNTLSEWGLAILVLLLVALGFEILRRLILRRIHRAEQLKAKGLDRLIEGLLRGTSKFFIFMIALYLAVLTLTLPVIVTSTLKTLVIVVAILQCGFWGTSLIDYFVKQRIQARPEVKGETATTMNAISLVGKIALWTIVVLLILENLTGMEIGTLLAALGIGGIAVALAVQGILGDLFSSISISLDKPFVIGDTIGIDDQVGTVEDIGLKSTRIRSVSGEQLIISNTDLLSSRLRNLQRMHRRRVLFSLGLSYQTPSAKLSQVPGLLQEIIAAHDITSFGHAYFHSYGDAALNFEAAYFLETPDFQAFVDTQNAINQEIFRRFEAEGIQFAYPAQTFFIEHLVE